MLELMHNMSAKTMGVVTETPLTTQLILVIPN